MMLVQNPEFKRKSEHLFLKPKPLRHSSSSWTARQAKNTMVFSQEVNVEWTVVLPNSSEIHMFNPAKERPHMVSSNVFQVGNGFNSPSRWRMQLSDDYFHLGKTRTVAIYLCRQTNNFEAVQHLAKGQTEQIVQYRISILDKSLNPAFNRDCGYRKFNKGDCYGWRDFVPWEKVKPLISKNTLKVRLQLRVLSDPFELNPTNARVSINDRLLAIAKKSYDDLAARGNLIQKTSMEFSSDFKRMIKEQFNRFLKTGDCPLLTQPYAFQEKQSLYQIALTHNHNDLMVKVFASMCNFLDIYSVVNVIKFAHSNALKRPKSPYASSYNKLQEYFLKFMEEIKSTDNFKASFKLLDKTFADLIVEDHLDLEEEDDDLEALINSL